MMTFTETCLFSWERYKLVLHAALLNDVQEKPTNLSESLNFGKLISNSLQNPIIKSKATNNSKHPLIALLYESCKNRSSHKSTISSGSVITKGMAAWNSNTKTLKHGYVCKRCGSGQQQAVWIIYRRKRRINGKSEHKHIRKNKLAITIEIQYRGQIVLPIMSKDIMNKMRKDYFYCHLDSTMNNNHVSEAK